MSIINDAIKKARRDFEWKYKTVAKDAAKEKNMSTATHRSSETKWVATVVASLVLIVSLLGSMFVYKHVSKLSATYSPKETASVKAEIPAATNQPRQHIISSPQTKLEDVLELNGIVYGPKSKWAIINNRIVREGDSLLDGRLAFIAKDFVRIEKSDGEEIVLELR